MARAGKWRYLFSSSLVLIFASLINLLYPGCKFTYATDTLLPGQSLNCNQSILSKNGAFRLGFALYCNQSLLSNGAFRLGSAFNQFGIWFVNSSYCVRDNFPVWEPRMGFNYYVDMTSFSLSEDGILSVNDGPSGHAWSSDYLVDTSMSVVAVLLDNRNLVIRDQSNISRVLWQSFDSPTDILLSGGRLEYNGTSNRYLTSHFGFIGALLQLDSTRRQGFIITNFGNYLNFSGIFPTWVDIREEEGYGVLTFKDAHTYMRLDAEYGIIQIAKLGECDSILWSMPENACGVGSNCGPYGLCTWSVSCMCIDGFEEGSQNYEGCLRKEPLNCESSSTEQEVTFYPVLNIYRFPDNSLSLEIETMKECELYCSRNCTGTAFAYKVTCLLWYQQLRNTVLFDYGSNVDYGLNGSRIYVRIATKQQEPGSTALKEVIIPSMLGMLALIAIGSILLCRCIRKLLKGRVVDENGSLTVFSFAQIKNSTRKFSEKLGEGGCGYVFKGVLPGCTFVAIKKLKGLRQEDKQFRAEVQTIGMIQHINIVRLLGFCAEDSGRFLVYEYMVNGSLSNHLFSKSSSKFSWELRYLVALGIARGLAYLHEGCKDCIVHCDIKPDNVLLDAEFYPKIADFGMAKLLGRDYSRVLTTMRGTIGYLAPEWISGLPITHKADVYSYGMMLFEIISGRRNSKKIKEGRFTYFPIYASVKLNEGDVMCLLDSDLESNADAEQLTRACRVACWCIQDAEDHRPMMGQVVRMLEGVMDVEVPPVPRSLQNYVGMEDSSSADMNSF